MKMASEMKIKKSLLFLLLYAKITFCQDKIDLLQRYAASFGGTDTVVIFGSINDYYGKYVMATGEKSSFIELSYRNGRFRKISDSTANCSDCMPIMNFVKANYQHISNGLDSGGYLWYPPKLVNGMTTSESTSSLTPISHYLGLYHKGVLKFSFFDKKKNINCLLDRGGYYYWMYFSLLKHQWPKIAGDPETWPGKSW